MAAAPTRPKRGRPRKVVMGDESTEWLRPASAARLLDLPRSTMSDMMHGRAQVREPLVVRHLPNGQARISRASVLAQLAGVMIALAVEQSGAAIVSPALLTPDGMGSAAGKVLASGARLGGLGRIGGRWDRFAGAVGDMPTGRALDCLGICEHGPISPVISPVSGLDSPGFNQGGRGSDLGGRADGRIHSGSQNNFALARLPESGAAADKRKCPVCLLSVCPAAWVQCFGEDDCPSHWELFKKEGGAA